ncbi:FKBP-type peptidyl-prolyl cis-trans isomerase [Malonomonas rubra]|uniref:FKBP-type peptidyl-prolyl cis-trans isomerase N-terminal domain-containing protein n=1 Tax=Malonomonas rubra TaxID=57040 RepID=UPI0026E95497|nr:FKBP-type peptidyl-prolyl cis-trans isomerase [Malonomonas rubra]
MRLKINKIIFFLLLLCASFSLSHAEEEPEMSGLNAVSYSAGFRLGDTFIKQRVPLVPEMVMRGLEDARNTIKPKLPNGQMRMILRDPKKYLIEDMNSRADLAKKSGQTFLEANAQEPGVKTLESGLQYKIIAPGSGAQPKASDSVQLNYQATTINGQVFDSTDKTGAPATLQLTNVIQGLKEGLQLLAEGGKGEFYIPAELAYGSNGPLGNQVLVYTVELIKVLPNQ